MFEKMARAQERYNELTELLSDPDILARQELWQQYSRELASLTPGVELYRRYGALKRERAEARELVQEEQDGTS